MDLLSLSWIWVRIRIAARLVAGQMTRVIPQQRIQIRRAEGTRSSRVRICVHGTERKRFYRGTLSGVEVHVFFVAVGQEEVVARPTASHRWQRRRIKFQRHLFSGAKDGEAVVATYQQRKNVFIAGV